jgi:nucleoside-diphosphate-sugar epimerase
MTILVTGSNGFIGQYIYKTKILNKYNIIYGTTSDVTYKNFQKFSKCYSNIELVLAGEQIDTIIHLASKIPTSFESADSDLLLENIKMMSNLTNFALNHHITKMIYISTYGSMNKPSQYDIKDYYTLSKVMGEFFCRMLETNGIQTASLRISSPFGEYSHIKNVIQIFTDAAIANLPLTVYGTGKREQNFIYVGNIVRCIKACIKTNISGVYDLVGDKNLSMLELAKLIVKVTNSKSVIKVGNNIDPLENTPLPIYSLARTKKRLNYQTKTSLEDGLEKYVQWRKKSIE